MRRSAIFFALLACCARPGDPPQVVDAGAPEPDAGVQPISCSRDADCPAGNICESCESELFCVPGCRADLECPEHNICGWRDQCLTCPCGRLLCGLGCRDDDGDGFRACGSPAYCGTDCDCDDHDRYVRPTAVERCGDGVDSNCDGADDTGCRRCPGGAQTCQDDWQCGLGRATCDVNHCCVACPLPTCPNAVQIGIDPQTGCAQLSCSPIPEPVVCLLNGSSVNAGVANDTVAHHGPCLPGEGLFCFGFCDPDGKLRCRDNAGGPDTCVAVGTCITASDCVEPPEPIRTQCPSGSPPGFQCFDNECVLACP